jgi:hypothetical protein
VVHADTVPVASTVTRMNMWTDRAMPLLLAIREAQEDFDVVQQSGPQPEYLADKVGLDDFVVRRTLNDLWDDGLITGIRTDDSGGFHAIGIRLTPTGLRQVGEWPTAESSFDALKEALTDLVESQPDPDRRSRLDRVLAGVKALPRDLAVELGGAYLARVSGIG